MKKLSFIIIPLAVLVLFSSGFQFQSKNLKVTPTPTYTRTATATLVSTVTPTQIATQTPTATPTETSIATPTEINTPQGTYAPYPSAPLCSDSGVNHDNSLFHTLWDSTRGCHYDHEHGQNPFTQEVADEFPGFNLFELLGNVQIGGTNPSSQIENTDKHEGFKWNVQLQHPQPCVGFENSTYGANGSVVEYHAFGPENVELESRIHSSVILLRECSITDTTDYGYIYLSQFQDYGQRVIPYQGTIVAYPNQPVPAYPSNFGPYIATDCVGNVIQCRSSIDFVKQRHLAVSSTWTSKNTGPTHPYLGSVLFNLLFRLTDGYQLFDWSDQVWPFVYQWVCSTNGTVYNPIGCTYNNSTTQVQEIKGKIPAEWDNLAGFDTNPTVGRITGEGYVTQFGDGFASCTHPGDGCFPIKLVNAFVGTWGSVLVFTVDKGLNIVPVNPERDIYFCNGVVCPSNQVGAVSSGWIGPKN